MRIFALLFIIALPLWVGAEIVSTAREAVVHNRAMVAHAQEF